MGRRGHVWERKGTGQYYATIGGQQIPLGDDRAEAEREFHRIKSEGAKVAAAGITLGGLADMFMQFAEREREPETATWYRFHLKGFTKKTGATMPAASIGPKHVTAWLADHPTWGATTRSLMIMAVKRLYAWGVKEGHIAENPMKGIEKPAPRRRERVMTADQVATVMKLTERSPGFHDFLTALKETGCRPIEVRTLTIDRVDLDSGTWKVRNKTARKTGEPWRTIYLTPAMIEMSRRIIGGREGGFVFLNAQGRPWTQSWIIKRFIEIRKATGFKGEAVAYSFRHIYITDALQRGIPPATVAELVGHTSLNMIMRVYSQLKHRTDHLRDAARMAREDPTSHT